MRKRKNNIFEGADWVLILLYLIFIFLGWLSIYAASYSDTQFELFDLSSKYGKQLIWISLSVILIVVILAIDKKFYENFSGVIYIISAVSLLGLFIFGNNINGATSWYSFGGFSIQPSEFAKAATALAIANFLNERNQDLRKLSNQLKAFGIIFLPALLITFQPDPGSALVYGSIILVLYRFGLPRYYLIIGGIAVVLFILTLYFGYLNTLLICLFLITAFIVYLYYKNRKVIRHQWMVFLGIYFFTALFIFSVDYVFTNIFEQRHRDRFNILLGKNIDTQGIGYNTDQSVITISSGGLSGKGFLQGDRTQGHFVPEQQTDYIYSFCFACYLLLRDKSPFFLRFMHMPLLLFFFFTLPLI